MANYVVEKETGTPMQDFFSIDKGEYKSCKLKFDFRSGGKMCKKSLSKDKTFERWFLMTLANIRNTLDFYIFNK